LLRLEDPQAWQWYMVEAATHNWSTRGLERQIGMLYYERLLTSGDRQPVRQEASEKLVAQDVTPRDFVRDLQGRGPYASQPRRPGYNPRAISTYSGG
jgi:predicted nuclease of restriction endonuclease-like (RecB) superfamily